jgi:hypothetical protein
MRLGQNACLGNCLDEFDGSGERSRAIMALLLAITYAPLRFRVYFLISLCIQGGSVCLIVTVLLGIVSCESLYS